MSAPGTHDAIFLALLLVLHSVVGVLVFGVLGTIGGLRSLLLLSLPELALAVLLVVLHVGGSERDGGGGATEHFDF